MDPRIGKNWRRDGHAEPERIPGPDDRFRLLLPAILYLWRADDPGASHYLTDS